VSQGYLTVSNPSEYGAFGQKTQDAVRKFQSDNGITSNGVVGPLTRAEIREISCGAQVVDPIAPAVALPDGCVPGAMFSYTTGLPCSLTATTTSPITITNQSASVVLAGDNPSKAYSSFNFTVTNLATNTIYISKNISTAFVANSSAASSSLLTLAVTPGTLAGDTYIHFTLPAQTSRTFTIAGYMDNTSGTAGVKEQRIVGFNYSDDTVNLQKFRIEKGLEGLKTSISLTGNGSTCPIFNRNLTIGSRGTDVLALQEYFLKHGYMAYIPERGYFDDLTSRAVAAWQAAVNITGESSFGPLSRAYLNGELCGIQPPSVTVVSPNGGETWIMGNKYNVALQSYGLDGTQAKVHLIREEKLLGTACLLKYISLRTGSMSEEVDISKGCLNNSEFGSITSGAYRIGINAGNVIGTNDISNQPFKIVVPATSTQPLVTVITPNGGETYTVGSTLNVVFTSTFPIGSPYRISLVGKGFDSVIGTNRTDYGEKQGMQVQIPLNAVPSNLSGSGFVIRVSLTGSCNNTYCTISDLSDQDFTVTASSTAPQTLMVAAPNGGEVYYQGSYIPFTLVYKNLTGPVLAYLYNPEKGDVMSYKYGNYGGTGTTTGTFATNGDILPGQYKITACDETAVNPTAPGKPLCDFSDNYFTIASSTSFRLRTSQPLSRATVLQLLQKAQAANAVEAVKGFMNMLRSMTGI
jgi:peptidoglycan hydrolase-like protein with peptidoglycan-binding domain